MRQEQQKALVTTAFHKASDDFKGDPSHSMRQALDKARLELDMHLEELAEKQLRQTRHLFHQKGNKQETLLACLRSQDMTFKPITLKIGVLTVSTTNPVDIVWELRTQLERLYKGSPGFCTERADALFSGISFSYMSTELSDSMERAIEELEVTFTIKHLKANKKLGPDGFPASYYKKFSEILSPRLTVALSAILENDTFSPQALQVHVCMIPKPGTDNSH